MSTRDISVTVNGVIHEATVEPRLSAADFLRDRLCLTGTTVGCEQGVCGACTILVDGSPVRSCIRLAVQLDQHEVTTIEGLAECGELAPLQDSFRENHGMQCGFCTSGFLVTSYALLRDGGGVSEVEAREQLQGNVCRCTGYQNIVKAVVAASPLADSEGRA